MSQARDLAAALRRNAVDAGTSTPSVRGADCRLATVATVGTDGTITTVDGIVARRLQSYTGPAVGDLISITLSSAGSWLATGKLESGDGGWIALTLAAGWTPLANYFVPSYRVYADGTAGLSGLAVMSGTLTSGAVVTTLPEVARPTAQVRFTVQVITAIHAVMTIFPSGNVTLGDFTAALSPTGSKWAQFDVAARYRRI